MLYLIQNKYDEVGSFLKENGFYIGLHAIVDRAAIILTCETNIQVARIYEPYGEYAERHPDSNTMILSEIDSSAQSEVGDEDAQLQLQKRDLLFEMFEDGPHA